jgi:hypothetical protein
MTIMSRISMLVVLFASFAPVACGTGSDATSLLEGAPSDAIVVTAGDLEGEVSFATRAPIVETEDGLAVEGMIDGELAELRVESLLADGDTSLESVDPLSDKARRPPVGGGGGVGVADVCFRCSNCRTEGGVTVCDCTQIPCPILALQ